MPTIPTGRLERELRALYLRWLAGVPRHQDDLQQYIAQFQEQSLALIAREGGRVAMKGALADFPVPKLLELSPTAGVVYSDMKQAAIQAGIAAGLQSKDVARQMLNAGFDKSYRRLERLARTETTNAYWKNAFASTADLPNIVMVWGAEQGKRTCQYCLSRDGLVIEDSNIRDHPNGRCTPIPTPRSMVKYKGTLQADGTIYMDPRWAPKSDKPLSLAELQTMPKADLEKLIKEKQDAVMDVVHRYEKRVGSRNGLLDDVEYRMVKNDLNAAYTQMKVLQNAEAKAKALAKVGTHPKVDKLRKLPAAPMNLQEAYGQGVANPWGWKSTRSLGYADVVKQGDYLINCTRVAWAVEMRMRGYDVRAGAAGKTANKSDAWIKANWVDPATGKPRNLKKESAQATMIKNMEKMPEGSRFFVIAAWKTGGAHIWNAEIRGGKLIFHEGQINRTDSGTPEFTRDRFQKMDFDKYKGGPAAVRWMRVDDLEPTDMAITRKWAE